MGLSEMIALFLWMETEKNKNGSRVRKTIENIRVKLECDIITLKRLVTSIQRT